MVGFDLTAIAPPSPVGSSPSQAQPTSNEPTHQTRPVSRDPRAPQTLDDALTMPITAAGLVDEDGEAFQDKLKKRNPMLHKQLWQVDKFANHVVPVQKLMQQEDGSQKLVWVDANGNMPVDPDTGEVLLKPKS